MKLQVGKRAQQEVEKMESWWAVTDTREPHGIRMSLRSKYLGKPKS